MERVFFQLQTLLLRSLPFVFLYVVFFTYLFSEDGKNNIPVTDLGTGYSMGVDHYVELNELGLCGQYKDFVSDYVTQRQSYRLMKNRYTKKETVEFRKDINNRAKKLLMNKEYGHLFRDYRSAIDELEVVNMGRLGMQNTDVIIADNTIKRGLKVQRYGKGSYAGGYQPRLFSEIEYLRCKELDEHFNIFQKIYYLAVY